MANYFLGCKADIFLQKTCLAGVCKWQVYIIIIFLIIRILIIWVSGFKIPFIKIVFYVNSQQKIIKLPKKFFFPLFSLLGNTIKGKNQSDFWGKLKRKNKYIKKCSEAFEMLL